MLSCREICENAQEYTDGNSSVWMRTRIWLHLAMCRNCTNFVDQTRKTKQLISRSLARDNQAELSPDILAAFRQKGNQTPADNSVPDGARGRRESDDT